MANNLIQPKTQGYLKKHMVFLADENGTPYRAANSLAVVSGDNLSAVVAGDDMQRHIVVLCDPITGLPYAIL